MNIKIISRKLIKPSTPTPQNLKNYKISFKDELSPPSNFGFILFYKSKKPESIAQLEQSLSEILPQFYPLAGRFIKKDHIVDCNDQGVEFIEAVVVDQNDVVLTDVSDAGEVEGLLPQRGDRFIGPTDPVLSVQITELSEFGGLALGLSMSHRIFDASSISTFLRAWSNANRGGKIVIVPSFDPHLLFPGKNLSYFTETNSSQSTTIISRRFLFNKDSITKLRSKLKPKQGAQNALSKVRIVSAVVAKTLIRIDGLKNHQPRPRFLIHAVDMRGRTIPPFPAHSCGNLVLHSVAKCMKDLGIQELVDTIGDAIAERISDCKEILSRGEEGHVELMIKPEVELIEGLKTGEVTGMSFSDWSKYGLYEVDFGWGPPEEVLLAPVPYERVVVLMNDRDGDGIEAWVNLEISDMVCFEEDEEIKSLTTS